MATDDGSSPAGNVIVLITLTWVPVRVATVTEWSARLAIRISVPALLMAIPEGCLPTVTVSTRVGGRACRSITNSLLSGLGFHVPLSSTHSTELATSATCSSGVMARLVGGPNSEFIRGKVPTIRGASRWLISTMTTASFPGGRETCFPASSISILLSRPITKCWACPTAIQPISTSPTASQNARGAPIVWTMRMLPPVQYGEGLPVYDVAALEDMDVPGWGG